MLGLRPARRELLRGASSLDLGGKFCELRDRSGELLRAECLPLDVAAWWSRTPPTVAAPTASDEREGRQPVEDALLVGPGQADVSDG